MKNEVRFKPSFSGLNLPAKKQWRQAQPAATGKKWRIPATPEYLGAIREADNVVTQFILNHISAGHNARIARFAKN